MGNKGGETVYLGSGTVVRVTDRALLIDMEGSREWYPRSVVTGGDSMDEGEDVEVEVERWFAKKQGWV